MIVEEKNSMAEIDPYTFTGNVQPPPDNWRDRVKFLGPSLIISGSIVGSGEIILTSSLGAAAGFILLWWVLMSCWIKSLVQAELARYTIVSGDTYLRALNRLPGKIPGPRGPVSWPVWLGLIAFIPGIMGVSGILGGAGQALSLLFPVLDSKWATAIVALATMVILGTGGYKGLERIMLFLVLSFTATTLVCAVLMQFTQYRLDTADLVLGLSFNFPVEYMVLALAVYGYTGVNSGETATYTYWCIEKGYPGFIGENEDREAWLQRARGWVRVLHMDVWVTLAILTCATLPFYVLGAGVLHDLGETPSGLETISVLSGMFTETLGPWALWIFSIGAFFILFSTTLASIGGGGRFVPDYLIELGFLQRQDLATRLKIIRTYVLLVPVVGLLVYLSSENPVFLVTIGAITAALFLPIQSGATLYLHHRYLDPHIRPGRVVTASISLIFLFQLFMGFLVVRYVILAS
jgi:manganese transport protein